MSLRLTGENTPSHISRQHDRERLKHRRDPDLRSTYKKANAFLLCHSEAKQNNKNIFSINWCSVLKYKNWTDMQVQCTSNILIRIACDSTDLAFIHWSPERHSCAFSLGIRKYIVQTVYTGLSDRSRHAHSYKKKNALTRWNKHSVRKTTFCATALKCSFIKVAPVRTL